MCAVRVHFLKVTTISNGYLVMAINMSNKCILIAIVFLMFIMQLILYNTTAIGNERFKEDATNNDISTASGSELLFLRQQLFQLVECFKSLGLLSTKTLRNVSISESCHQLVNVSSFQPGIPPHVQYLDKQPLAGSMPSAMKNWMRISGANCQEGTGNKTCPCVPSGLSEYNYDSTQQAYMFLFCLLVHLSLSLPFMRHFSANN